MKKGVTFVEVLLVMVILSVLIVGAVMTINPILQVNKGKDARRKKDLARIKIAFEEHYNDKGCYPTQEYIDDLACGDNFYSYLKDWPCDPDGSKYAIFIESEDECPGYYRVYGKLQWEDDTQAINCDYGESSSNVDWRDFPDEYETGCPSALVAEEGGEEEDEEDPIDIPACCDVNSCCTLPLGGPCNSTDSCSGDGCYYNASNCPEFEEDPCLDICKTDSCGQ